MSRPWRSGPMVAALAPVQCPGPGPILARPWPRSWHRFLGPARVPVPWRSGPNASDAAGATGPSSRHLPPDSHDPNAKTGPGGITGRRASSPTNPAPLPRRLRKRPHRHGPGPARGDHRPARRQFDWSTFQFTEVGFGDNMIDHPGRQPAFPDHRVDDLQRPDVQRPDRAGVQHDRPA